jgi:hypothetical protein
MSTNGQRERPSPAMTLQFRDHNNVMEPYKYQLLPGRTVTSEHPWSKHAYDKV